MAKIYVVFEGGGVDFDAHVHGIFNNLGHAKECLKNAVLAFIRDYCTPHTNSNDTTVVDKTVYANYTYIYVYLDENERDFGAYLNCFVLYEGESNV